MRVLITNNTLAARMGSETSVRDLARALRARGHEPAAYSNVLGEIAREIQAEGTPVVADLDELPWAPDIIHGQHHMETFTALLRFPRVPCVYFMRGWIPWEERPPLFRRIAAYAAVDQPTLENAVEEHRIPRDEIRLILNGVDFERFPRRGPLPASPRRALVFSNYADATLVKQVARACRRTGLKLDVAGIGVGKPVRDAYRKLLAKHELRPEQR